MCTLRRPRPQLLARGPLRPTHGTLETYRTLGRTAPIKDMAQSNPDPWCFATSHLRDPKMPTLGPQGVSRFAGLADVSHFWAGLRKYQLRFNRLQVSPPSEMAWD